MGKYVGLELLTDLDGTLLTPEKRLHPTDAAAIATFRAEGGRFSIATGRGVEATKPYFDLLQPDFPAVLYNGGVLYDTKAQRICAVTYLPACSDRILRTLMAEFPQVGAEVLNAEGVFVIQDGEYERRHLEITGIPVVLRSLDELPPTQCYKALFAGAPEQIDRMMIRVQAADCTGVSYTRSHDWFLEILPPNVSKGSALTQLRTMLPAGTIIGASGDFDNDIAMLQAADYAGCPWNAQPHVRAVIAAVGGYHAPKTCAEGFFADWVHRFLQDNCR